MKVLLTTRAEEYFDELETILYEKGYFSFKESSRKYVHELFHDIRDTLPTRPHRPAPAHFDRYGGGMWYATFRRSRATTWYVFFTRHEDPGGETVFLVRRIENNHTAAHYF
jgi:plasmid stabilization system protein ParE